MILHKRDYNKLIQNQKGLLTLDFMIGIIITFAVMLFLFRVSFSLMMVEVSQYVAFSVARAQSAADVDLEKQRVAAKSKYNQIVKNPEWQHFFKGVFAIGNNGNYSENFLKSGIGSVNGTAANGHFEEYLYKSNYDGSDVSGIPFVGVVLPIKLGWLNMNIPLLGSTSETDQEFKAKVTGFLIREPTQYECHDFFKKRYQKVLNIDSSRFNHPSITRGINSYVRMEDNGC